MTPSASPARDVAGSPGPDELLVTRLIRTTSELALSGTGAEELAAQWRELGEAFTRFRLYYQFGIEEVLTKVNILRQEFENTHAYSPIEHVRSRLKSPESLIGKVARYGCEPSIPAVRERVRDIAGIRITCSFESDVYWIASMLTKQPDVTLIQTKDYIAHPKPNGYRSLHLIVQVPVFLSDHTELVYVEIQIRTIAMDFWASVEHKLFYKYRQELPEQLVAELDDAARIAAELDLRMARLRDEIRSIGGPEDLPDSSR